jgi:undecaprenyl-diphosphatase
MSLLELDYQVFQTVNNLSATLSFLNPLMSFLAQDAEYVFYLGVIIYWFTRTYHNRRMVVEALLSASIGLLISGIVSHFLYRDRPFVTHSVLQLIKHPANASFPSDHAIGAFVIATAIWLFRKKLVIIWIAIAGCIAISRIWTGVHYPSDVIAGAVIGMVTAVSVHQLFDRWPLAKKGLQAGIQLYVNLERRVWPQQSSSK